MKRFRMRHIFTAVSMVALMFIGIGLVACESSRQSYRGLRQTSPSEIRHLRRAEIDQTRRYYAQSDSYLGREVIPTTPSQRRWQSPLGNEAYAYVPDNRTTPVGRAPLSTFSTDVDTASYANIRRFINQGQKPPAAAVRIEEMINYFSYAYPEPTDGHPVSVTTQVGPCPWNSHKRLLRVGLKGRDTVDDIRKPSNLVFLVDISGSMKSQMKLPLVVQLMRMLVRTLGPEDYVSIVVYASGCEVRLEPTSCANTYAIERVLDRLHAGGSTNGSGGLKLAYEMANHHFVEGGINRVILCTDGDFNVGATNGKHLVQLVKQRAQSGVYLTILGYGIGNLKDATLEAISNEGNGNHAYIDSLQEARKVLVEQASGTLETIAKDVKVQIEFNPAKVQSYRLLGYENRKLAKRDFNNDFKDAGDMGVGHTVTALYELTIANSYDPGDVDSLKYQPSDDGTFDEPLVSDELLTVKVRYKEPDGFDSRLIVKPVDDQGGQRLDGDFRFAAAVAGFGMILRDSGRQHRCTLETVRQLALSSRQDDTSGYRAEFIRLVEMYESIN